MLFCDRPSRSASGHITTLKTFWRSVTAKAALENVRLYDLRSTFATRLMERGTDIATIMQATGHTTVSILLKHYAKSEDVKQQKAVEGLF